MSLYALRPFRLLVQDSPERIDFHVRTGDYLAHLATLMGFLEEAIAKCGSPEITERERGIARELRHDLRYVQSNYTVTPRSLGDVRLTHPGRNLLAK